MKIITAANGKGGSGKSSMVAGIASYLHWKKKKTFVLDLDTQATLGNWLHDEYPDIDQHDPTILTVEHLKIPLDPTGAIETAMTKLGELQEREDLDYLVIDTKGEQGQLTAAISSLSHHVLCPTNTHIVEFEPIVRTYMAIETVMKKIGSDKKIDDIFRVVITRRTPIVSADVKASAESLRKNFTLINGPAESSSYSAAFRFGTTIDCLMTTSERVIHDETMKAGLRANAKKEYDRHSKSLGILEGMMEELTGKAA